MEYTIIVEHDPATGLYCGQCEQLPEAISQGATEGELMDNIREAIELVLEDRRETLRQQYRNRPVHHRTLHIATV